MARRRTTYVTASQLNQVALTKSTKAQSTKVQDLIDRGWHVIKVMCSVNHPSVSISVSMQHTTGAFVVVAPDGSMRRPYKGEKSVRWNWDEFDFLAKQQVA